MKRLFRISAIVFALTSLLLVFTACDFRKPEPKPDPPKTYTITYRYPEGEEIEKKTLNHGSIPSEPVEPSKEGFAFAGWYTDAELTNKYKFDNAFNANITLYARMLEGYNVIKTKEELIAVKDNPSGYYLLTDDISLADEIWTPIEDFSGILDGNGHKIYNFKFSSNEVSLGFVNLNNGTIRDIIIEPISVTYNRDCSGNLNAYVGIVAAKNNGTLEKCRAECGNIDVQASVINVNKNETFYLGGLAGLNTGTVTNCYSNGKIKCVSNVKEEASSYFTNYYAYLNSYLGGAVGENRGVIEKTTVEGSITATGEVKQNGYGHAYSTIMFGGIAGINTGEAAKIYESQTNLTMNAEYTGSPASNKNMDMGLIVGYNSSKASVKNCIAKGAIAASANGQALTGTIGGGVGYNCGSANISNLYVCADIRVGDTVTTFVGGILGSNDGTVNGVAKAALNKSIFEGNIEVSAGVTSYGFAVSNANGLTTSLYRVNESALIANGSSADAGTYAPEVSEDKSTIIGKDFIFNTLLWEKDIWQINDGESPSLKCFVE